MDEKIKKTIIESLNYEIELKKTGLSIVAFEKKNNLSKNSVFKRIAMAIGRPKTRQNAPSINLFQSVYFYAIKNKLNFGSLLKELNISYGTFHVYKYFFDTVSFTYPYIKENNLPITTHDYGWEIVEAIKNGTTDKFIDMELINKHRKNKAIELPQSPPKTSFHQLTPVENKPSKEILATTESYDIVPSNEITLQTSDGIKVFVPESVNDEKLMKLMKLIRSL